MGSVMMTSANWPTSDGGPMKLTQRWFSVRPASSRALFTDSRSTRMRCTENQRWVNFIGPASLVGQFADVVITEPMRNSLRGRLVAGETHKSVA